MDLALVYIIGFLIGTVYFLVDYIIYKKTVSKMEALISNDRDTISNQIESVRVTNIKEINKSKQE